ncbi:MAG: Gfo/Idh/MocA family oxidoreductase [Cyanobacteria bacterium RYN_339]|nr:Gfo/Idh/MocA family oxidoreductase [Cyanobacteria bacterium RYN_339]
MSHVAVIGAGNWGKNLVTNFHALGVLASVSEASPALREGLFKQYPDLPVYADYQEVLAGDVPAVAIATPVPTHYPIAKEALLAGKDVFVEKPITLSLAEAEDLAELARKLDRVLMVGHLLLYQPAIQWIKQYLAAGELGTVHSLHQERMNLGRARTVENVLWSFGVHDVAVLLHLVGAAPTHIQATGQRVLQAKVEDDVYLHLGFPQGVQAHLHTSWLWPERRRGLTVVGSLGMLVYDEIAQTVTLHKKGITPDLANRDYGAEVVFSGSGEPLKLELQHFLDRVADRAAPLSDGASGVEVVRVLAEASRQLEAV